MDSEVLSREEVQMIHNMRRNPFFRKMIEKVIAEYKEGANAADQDAAQVVKED